jgi:hypothetical protein
MKQVVLAKKSCAHGVAVNDDQFPTIIRDWRSSCVNFTILEEQFDNQYQDFAIVLINLENTYRNEHDVQKQIINASFRIL